MIESEAVVDAAGLRPEFGPQTDRQAAHYYRAQHRRAVEREKLWQQKAKAAEKILLQLLFALGFLVRQVAKLTAQLAWLNKQVFGAKSESQKGASTPEDPAKSPADAGPANKGPAAQGTAGGKRGRGQQRGAKGPKRQRPVNLPVTDIDHRLEEAQRVCPCCGKVRPEIGLTEDSEEIGWEVRLVRRRHKRHRYGPACACPPGQGIRTAPKPDKLIPKGLFAVDFWVEVLLKKFEYQQPLERTVRELASLGLAVSPGTLCGGLQKIKGLLDPLAGRFVAQAREGSRWHMDETRWPMFSLAPGEGRKLWWFWTVVTEEVTVFLLEPSRSGQVPQAFFPKGCEGILNVDRYAGYFALLGADWQMQLAYCWSHQRRDFVNAAPGSDLTAAWAGEWVGSIDELFALNRRRRKLWFQGQRQPDGPFAALDQAVRRQVQRILDRLDLELAGGKLRPEQEKILRSMRRHWKGLCLFVGHPEVPMDNNAAERALRRLAVGRKNYYGSGAQWSGELASAAFTILATLRQHRLCPRKFFQSYLDACARNRGRPPDNLAEFLPWTWGEEKRAAWKLTERAP